MSFKWIDLPKPLNVFTARNTAMRDLDTGDVIQYYSVNTRLTMVQKCVTEQATFYRTDFSRRQDLNWAFEAEALGLPNDFAPSVPSDNSNEKKRGKSSHSLKKQKLTNAISTKDGGSKHKPAGSFFKRLLDRVSRKVA